MAPVLCLQEVQVLTSLLGLIHLSGRAQGPVEPGSASGARCLAAGVQRMLEQDPVVGYLARGEVHQFLQGPAVEGS